MPADDCDAVGFGAVLFAVEGSAFGGVIVSRPGSDEDGVGGTVVLFGGFGCDLTFGC